jgi:hypothetical protein
MSSSNDESGGWKFAQCFGDKGDIEEVTEGKFSFFIPIIPSVP